MFIKFFLNVVLVFKKFEKVLEVFWKDVKIFFYNFFRRCKNIFRMCIIFFHVVLDFEIFFKIVFIKFIRSYFFVFEKISWICLLKF